MGKGVLLLLLWLWLRGWWDGSQRVLKWMLVSIGKKWLMVGLGLNRSGGFLWRDCEARVRIHDMVFW